MKRLMTASIALSLGSSALVAFPASAATSPPSPAASCSMPGSGYGELFPDLPDASWSTTDLQSLADAMIAPVDAPSVPDPEDNPAIPAMYTYFGQFVDHDLTFDNRPDDLVTPKRPDELVNGRTPQLDLEIGRAHV